MHAQNALKIEKLCTFDIQSAFDLLSTHSYRPRSAFYAFTCLSSSGSQTHACFLLLMPVAIQMYSK